MSFFTNRGFEPFSSNFSSSQGFSSNPFCQPFSFDSGSSPPQCLFSRPRALLSAILFQFGFSVEPKFGRVKLSNHGLNLGFARPRNDAAPDISICSLPEPASYPVNTAAVDLIKSFEKFRSEPYLDNGTEGYPTIGWGYKCRKPDCTELLSKSYTLPLSDAQGEKLFREKLQVAVDDVRAVVGKGVDLNENQFGALVSLAYNTGRGNLEKSKLISRLNKGEDQNTVFVEETMDWVHSGGKRVRGLENRREAERQLFVTMPSGAETVAAEQPQEDSEDSECVVC
ncbi:Lysozyme [Mycena sanguinolenta]|uniref:Lysozyme n=1 Tax=Mycena sanguinolenta TaxID=230812 RepID=A0A8H7CL31_9AGAR|nr:Lysozyme [Mycena sanguinolenta]